MPRRAHQIRRRVVRAAGLLGLAVALAGCGSSFDEGPPTTPEPRDLIRIPDLAGGYTTRIELRPGFVRGLRAAGVRAADEGDATLDDDLLTLPITSGNITIEPRGDRAPELDGRVDHDGAGLVLGGGGERVALEDLELDLPGGVVVAKVVRDGRTVAGTMPLLRFDLRTTEPVRLADGAPGAALDGIRVRLHPDGRALVREAFGGRAARALARLGTAKVTVNRAGPT